MVKTTPAMGWNSWNTFCDEISEEYLDEMTKKWIKQGCMLFTSK